jgi:hypothetical protein
MPNLISVYLLDFVGVRCHFKAGSVCELSDLRQQNIAHQIKSISEKSGVEDSVRIYSA